MITLQVNEYNSSTVLASKYEFASETLDILFENGAYRYLNVPVEVYAQFAAADSQGAALNQFIKGGQFETIKLDEEEVFPENDEDDSIAQSPE
jgi:hypothetical protein